MNVVTDHRKTQLKRWVETAAVPVLPLVAPRLPGGIINDAWPVFGRVYPRTVRWPLNGSRAVVWVTWQLCRVTARVPFLGLVVRLGWHLGAAVQAVFACIIAVAATVVIGAPLQILGTVARAVVWVVLVRRGWQPPLKADHLLYLHQLDNELETTTTTNEHEPARRLSVSSTERHPRAPAPVSESVLAGDIITPRTADSDTPTRPELVRVLVAVAALVIVGAAVVHVGRNGIPQPPEWDAIHQQTEQ